MRVDKNATTLSVNPSLINDLNFSDAQIAGMLGHELVHVSDIQHGVDITDPRANLQSELNAMKWQRETAATYGFDVVDDNDWPGTMDKGIELFERILGLDKEKFEQLLGLDK
ncbi:MAG: hypothetical protein GY820_14840 [Gammaproteobacteria bacterium]|nr:hypothetical protein [Gammaproteobacteria bacterium]